MDQTSLSTPVPTLEVKDIRCNVVGVTDRTNWVHVVIEGRDGQVGIGEATLDGYEEAVRGRVERLGARMRGSQVASIPLLLDEVGIENTPGNLVDAAALSGIEQAAWDLYGRILGLPVHVLLGSPVPGAMRLYANVNRALLADRSAQAFAAIAADAVAAGFTAVKCNPFDGLRRANLEDRHHRTLFESGLARLDAVRRAVGEEVDLIIDCGYRFASRSARQAVSDLEDYQPFWIEALVAEHRLEEWAEIRSSTTLRLAGGEMMAGLARFDRFIRATGVDVVMPDVKYAGGIAGLRAVGSLASASGIEVSPHNPSGPVGTLATLHAMSGVHNATVLEYAHGEVPWRGALVGGAELIRDGFLHFPDGPGFGFEFSQQIVADHPMKAVRGIDLRANG